MPRNEIDMSLITNEPHKQKLASYATDKDNVSADKDETVKRMKRTIDPCEYHEMLSIFLLVTNSPLDVSTSQKSPTIEEIEDEDMRPRGNIPPRNPRHVLESSDDEDSSFERGPHRKVSGPLAGSPSTLTRPKAQHSLTQSRSIDEADDEDTYLQPTTHPKKTWPGLEPSDDDRALPKKNQTVERT